MSQTARRGATRGKKTARRRPAARRAKAPAVAQALGHEGCLSCCKPWRTFHRGEA